MAEKPLPKICIVSPSLKMGGIERALSVLANYFVATGYQVFFISCLPSGKFYTLDPLITFSEPSFKRTSSFINKIIYYPRILFYVRKRVKQYNPDVVLSFGDNFNPLVLLALRGLKYPVFISDRTSPDFPFHKLVQSGKRKLYPRSAGFIAQTQRAFDYKKKQFGDALNMVVIPNAIKEVALYKTQRKNWIICVARLYKEKGPDRLLEAFIQVKDKRDWKLVFAGKGPMLDQLKNRVAETGLQDAVIFMGEVTAVDQLLSEAGIFVLPSRLEGFPNALCEAMSAGLPCVCFDCIPHEAIIQQGIDGYVVRDGDLAQMAATLQLLMDNDAERNKIGLNAMQIRDRLSVEKIGRRYLDFMFQNSAAS